VEAQLSLLKSFMSQNRSAYREFAFSATTDGRTLRFTRNNSSVRFMDTSRRPSGILGGVDPANLRIPAKEIAHSDLMSIKIEASFRWTVIC
jgi:hypothetical protein